MLKFKIYLIVYLFLVCAFAGANSNTALDSLDRRSTAENLVARSAKNKLLLENEIGISFAYYDDVLPENERLANRVKAYLITQTITSGNIYRYLFDTNKSNISFVNPFIYDAIPFRKEKLKSIRMTADNNWKIIEAYVQDIDFASSDYFSAYLKSKHYMAIHRPDLISISWNKLPDPPKITDHTYLPSINKIPFEVEYLKFDPFESYKPKGIDVKKRYWNTYGLIDLHFTQNHASSWNGKDASSFALLGSLNYDADYVKDKVTWESGLELKLGMIQTEKSDLYKNEDRLKINSKYGYKAVDNWSYAISLEFITQLLDGQKNEKLSSALLTPADIAFSVGMDLKKNKNNLKYSLLLSPVTASYAFRFDSTRTIFSGDYFSVDMGGSIRLNSTIKLKEDITWSSKFYVFQKYNDFNRIPKLDMEGILDLRINHLISARIALYLKYDEVNSKLMWQFNEYVSLGFRYAI